MMVGAAYRAAPFSVNQHPAVDVERDARQVARQVAQQEQARMGDVGGFAEPAERYALDDVLAHVGRQLVAGDVGLDQAGRDRIDADPVGAEFARHRLREAEHAGLGGAVVRAAEDAAAALRGHRRHADDAAAALLFHRGQHRLRHVQRAAQVHVDDRIEVARRDLQRAHGLRDAGVVHEAVDAAEVLKHRAGCGRARVAVGHVAGEAEMTGAEFGGGRFRVFAAQVEDRHACAVRGQRAGRGLADSARRCGAGDDDGPVVEQHRLSPVLMCCVPSVGLPDTRINAETLSHS